MTGGIRDAYRQLGRSGLKISPIAWAHDVRRADDEATSSRIVAKAREAGINFIDSADAYNGGRSNRWSAAPSPTSRQNWILPQSSPTRSATIQSWRAVAALGAAGAEESLKRLARLHRHYYCTRRPCDALEDDRRAMGD